MKLSEPFQAALEEMAIEQNVITLTELRVQRTMNSNGTNGSDHAWGLAPFRDRRPW